MKTILVDDEKQSLAVLEKSLNHYCPDLEIVAICSNAEEAEKAIIAHKPDLVFLDIAMPKKSGIQMLIEFECIDFMVIFVTAFDQYILQALRLSAIDYLLKPIQEHELVNAVAKAKTQLTNNAARESITILAENVKAKATTSDFKISLPTTHGLIIKYLKELIYCEADNTYTKFYFTDNSMIMVTKPLSYYDQLLSDCEFIRIHKSYLINENHIIEYIKSEGGSVKMTRNIQLDVSKRRKDILVDVLKNKYLS